VNAIAVEPRPAPSTPAVDGARAVEPTETGYVEREGVRTYYEVHGDGPETIVMLPTWTIFHSRLWKPQIPYLSRRYRVVSFDGRGGGRSDKPARPEDYAVEQIARDALAVMDATGTDSAALIGASRSAQWALWLATERPERVRALALFCPFFPASARSVHMRLLLNPRLNGLVMRPLPAYPGWLKFNPNYMTRDYEGFLRWFVTRVNSDPHSTRPVESLTAYGLETTGAVASATVGSPQFRTRRELLARARGVRCPTLVIHGTRDRITPYSDGKLLARTAGGELVAVPGGGHAIMARYPALMNTILRRFLEATTAEGR
jgi:pimeloyl-ACP methyl ester carboxylesterase